MTRSVAEWVGKTDDSAVPVRVRVRVFERFEGRCQCGCNRKVMAGERWDAEHTIAIINGGKNCESNLTVYLTEHHKKKTRDDLKVKSKSARIRARHNGVKKPRMIRSWRRMDGTPVYASRER